MKTWTAPLVTLVVLVVLVFIGVFIALSVGTPTALPECETEDGGGATCIWHGDQSGNGEGRTYIVYQDQAYYLEGQR